MHYPCCLQYDDHSTAPGSLHNRVVSQTVTVGRFLLGAIQDLANYTYPAVAASAASQLGKQKAAGDPSAVKYIV